MSERPSPRKKRISRLRRVDQCPAGVSSTRNAPSVGICQEISVLMTRYASQTIGKLFQSMRGAPQKQKRNGRRAARPQRCWLTFRPPSFSFSTTTTMPNNEATAPHRATKSPSFGESPPVKRMRSDSGGARSSSGHAPIKRQRQSLNCAGECIGGRTSWMVRGPTH
jgi:hypothetical protein